MFVPMCSTFIKPGSSGCNQSIGHLKVALITGKMKRDQHPIRQSTMAVRAGVLVGDGIAHIDHHIQRMEPTRAGVVGTSHCRDRTGRRAAEHHPEARAYHVRQEIFLVHENGCTRDLGIAYRAASTHTALRRAPLR
jgi:hypothetical protein